MCIGRTFVAVFLCWLFNGGWARAQPILWIDDFQNHSVDQRFDHAARGIAQMLITDLGSGAHVRIIERSKLSELESEIELGDDGFIDPETVVEPGKGLGATHFLTGAFVIMDDELRIDTRLINISTGEVIQSEQVSGFTSDFFCIRSRASRKGTVGAGPATV